MRGDYRARGFTLSELLAVIGIIAVLAAILFPVFAGARESARVVHCAANLHQIGVAAQLYHQDHHGPPMSRLPVSVGPYVDTNSIFVCPKDRDSDDSYSAFFVGRYNVAKASEFVVGCPRHHRGRKAAVLCGKSKSEVGPMGAITHNATIIGAGEFVEGGVLKFADGSRVDVQDGLSVAVLTSVSSNAGLHTVVWIPDGQQGSVDVTVTPGSRFEVLTPEVVAAVRGTHFRVTVYKEGYLWASYVMVYKGEVMVTSRVKPGKALLRAGEVFSVDSSLDVRATYKADTGTVGPGPWLTADPYDGR